MIIVSKKGFGKDKAVEFKKELDGSLWIQLSQYCRAYKFTKEEVEELKEWLEGGIAYRYQVRSTYNRKYNYSRIFDLKLKKEIALFYSTNDFDYEEEAKKLCKKLNEKDQER